MDILVGSDYMAEHIRSLIDLVVSTEPTGQSPQLLAIRQDAYDAMNDLADALEAGMK